MEADEVPAAQSISWPRGSLHRCTDAPRLHLSLHVRATWLGLRATCYVCTRVSVYVNAPRAISPAVFIIGSLSARAGLFRVITQLTINGRLIRGGGSAWRRPLKPRWKRLAARHLGPRTLSRSLPRHRAANSVKNGHLIRNSTARSPLLDPRSSWASLDRQPANRLRSSGNS